MSSIAVRMDHVYKKFKKGERYDSLREMLPAMAKRAFGGFRRDPMALEEREFWALQDICFEIKQGEAIGFVGHNGAGKSTILKLLTKIMRPNQGMLEVNGRLSALIEVGAGFHQDLTGRENIFLNGVILGMKREEIRRKFDEIVEFSGLEEFIDTPVKRYSSGMYARLGFSVAAHLEPEILVVDEVLSVGDQSFQRRSIEKMRSVLHGGSTVIFVSHNLRAVSGLCSRGILLKRGQVIEDGPVSDVIQTYLESISQGQNMTEETIVSLDSAVLRGRDGPRSDFDAGERCWLDVSFSAVKDVKDLVCVTYVIDSQDNLVFWVSSDALGEPPFNLRAGDRRHCTFELSLHLPTGSYGLCAMLCDVNGHPIAGLRPAATVLVRANLALRGVANLYPQLTMLEQEEKIISQA